MTDTPEMVECVGRAIYENMRNQNRADQGTVYGDCSWEAAEEDIRDWYRSQAGAAIEAMREPTMAMFECCPEISAAAKFNHGIPWQWSTYPTAKEQGYAPGRIWRAMIDAALGMPNRLGSIGNPVMGIPPPPGYEWKSVPCTKCGAYPCNIVATGDYFLCAACNGIAMDHR